LSESKLKLTLVFPTPVGVFLWQRIDHRTAKGFPRHVGVFPEIKPFKQRFSHLPHAREGVSGFNKSLKN